ncbi:MAG: NAD(P)-dependent oxidoreductase [Burkholderiales bacterium]
MPTVLVTESIHSDGLAMLRARPGLEVVEGAGLAPDALRAAEARADALLVRFHRCNPAFFERAPKVRLIARYGVGVDLIDLNAARDRGVTVAITADANTQSVVEHTTWMLLSLAKPFDRWRHGMAGLTALSREQWSTLTPSRYASRDEGLGGELGAKTLLVVGLGRIGRRVAQVASAIGMKVLVVDPYIDRAPGEALGYRFASSLREALPKADYLTVHCPRNAETLGMIGAAELALLPKGAAVVNCARGNIVDEAALAAGRASGPRAGAGIGGFDAPPPPPDHPLLALPNVFLTPHSAAATREAAWRMSTHAARNILDFLDGRLDPAMVFPVPPCA